MHSTGETNMILRKIAGMLLLSIGILAFLYGAYLFIEYFGGFAYLRNLFSSAFAALKKFSAGQEFREYAAVGSAIFFIVAGLLLILWGDRLTRR